MSFFMARGRHNRVGQQLISFIKMMNEIIWAFFAQKLGKCENNYDRLSQLPGQLLVGGVPMLDRFTQLGYGFFEANL